MFSYYGSKSKIVKYYPRPQYDTIIEPFAGSAAYSMAYFNRKIILIEKNEILVKLWTWLIHEATEKDILQLPDLKPNELISDITHLRDEEKYLMGFAMNRGSACPKNKVALFSDGWKQTKKRYANSLKKIRHWTIINGDYTDAPDTKATWFIDPPYQFGGEWYTHHKIDYSEVKKFILTRKGQVIACENTKAKWMDFIPLADMRGAYSTTTESIWTNRNDTFSNFQAPPVNSS